jgi:predicted SpoU family rRNA methylase
MRFLIALMFSLNSFCLLSFQKQIGQLVDQNHKTNENVLFSARSNDLTVLLTKTGFSYQIVQPVKPGTPSMPARNKSDLTDLEYFFNRVDVDFINCRDNFSISYSHPQPTEKYLYFGNNMEKVKVEIYQRVVYHNIYDKIDIEFTFFNEEFKYNIIVYPGANLDDIRVKYISDSAISISSKEIVIHTPLRKIVDFIPESFIEGSIKKYVDVCFHENNNGIGYKLIGTNLGGEDTLVIDPMPYRFFGTYLGGSNDEYANEITIDESGNTYVTGRTNSLNNIATSGTHQGTFSAVFDAFVAKFSPSGNRIWGTYIGGNSFDRAYGIDYNNGHLYVVGNSNSSNFATAGSHQSFSIDNDDAFIAKFDTTGNRIWCTYYGGELHDFAAAVVTDSDENIYVTGHTLSSFNIATSGAHLEIYSGNSAAFLAKFSSNGQLLWGTYYGNSFEEGWGITIDSDGNPIFSGFTASTTGIATVGSHQVNIGGGMDAFLAKFNQNGVRLWGTYFGGSNDDFGYEIDCDNQNNIYFVGGTSSPNNIYFNSGFQSSPVSFDNGFVAKFNNNGAILWGTYLGGNEADYLYGVKNYFDVGVLVTGMTQSSTNIATSNAFQQQLAGQYDALVAKLSTSGELEWGTYYGGPMSDEGWGIALQSSNGHFTIAGTTMSTSGISSSQAFQGNFGGGFFDVFLAKFCAPIFPSLDYGFTGNLCSNDNAVLSVMNPSFFDSFQWNNGSTNNVIDLNTLPLGSHTFYVNTLDTNNCPAYSDTLVFNKYESTPLSIQQNQTNYCSGDNLELWTSNIFDSYLWSTNSSDTIIEFQNLNIGTFNFSLIATNSDGCLSYDTVEIVVNPNPSPNLNVQGSANFCLGESVAIGVTGFYNFYSWFDGSNTSVIILEQEDSVWVYVENQFGCGGYSDTIYINSEVLTPEVVLLSSPPYCANSIVSFVVNNTYDFYLWMNGEEGSELNIALGPGTHYVYVDVSNQCGGSAQTDSLEVIIPYTTQANILVNGSDTLCIGEDYTFYLDDEFSFILWQNDFSADSLIFNAPSEGLYTFIVQTLDNNGCPSSDTLEIYFEDCNLALEERELPATLMIYPNPTSDKFTINFPSNLTISASLLDIKGKRIQSMEIFDGIVIDCSKIAKGIYMLIPDGPENFQPLKIVLQ